MTETVSNARKVVAETVADLGTFQWPKYWRVSRRVGYGATMGRIQVVATLERVVI